MRIYPYALSMLLSSSLIASDFERGLDSFFVSFNDFWGSILFYSDHPLKLPFILLVMLSGSFFFSFRYFFVNVRFFRHAIDVVRGKYDKKEDLGEITHFQALTSALSATVGLGNIAGVAIAISLGGPGAVFWLWLIGFFGMNMKFSSCTFAQLHRIVHKDGSVLGGPMVYLEKGFAEHIPSLAWLGKGFAMMFAFFTIVASLGGGNMFQGNQTYELMSEQIPFLASRPWLMGLTLALLVGVVIIGGIKRIGEVTSKLVPLMCAFYCLTCLTIILGNISAVPSMFKEIFTQAFNPDSIWAGGFMGVLIQGVKRASFSNEAGLGSAAIAHAAAKTDKPVREGLVAMLGPFIDTHMVCTMTALSILITGAHLDPSLAGKGALITATAFGSLGSFMPIALTLAIFVFAYSTMISWSYYGEKATEYLLGRKYIFSYRVVYVICVILGPVLSLKHVLDFSDLMLLTMAFPNIIGMMFLSKQVKILLDRYASDYKSGKMKVVNN